MPTTSSSTSSGQRSGASTISSGCGASRSRRRRRRRRADAPRTVTFPPRRYPAGTTARESDCPLRRNMILHIVARGKIGRGPEAELVERYLKRIAWPVKVTELPESGGRVPLPADGGVTILLDEKGEPLP